MDPKCQNFPWGSIESRQAVPMATWERIWISGRHGNWWQLRHRNVSEINSRGLYMDEHAVRSRAGLLNMISIVALMDVFFIEDPSLVLFLFPFVAWEFVSAMIFGLTSFATLGWIGTIMSIILQPKPLWNPANPKDSLGPLD